MPEQVIELSFLETGETWKAIDPERSAVRLLNLENI